MCVARHPHVRTEATHGPVPHLQDEPRGSGLAHGPQGVVRHTRVRAKSLLSGLLDPNGAILHQGPSQVLSIQTTRQGAMVRGWALRPPPEMEFEPSQLDYTCRRSGRTPPHAPGEQPGSCWTLDPVGCSLLSSQTCAAGGQKIQQSTGVAGSFSDWTQRALWPGYHTHLPSPPAGGGRPCSTSPQLLAALHPRGSVCSRGCPQARRSRGAC